MDTYIAKRYILTNIETGEIVLDKVKAPEVRAFLGKNTLNLSTACKRNKLYKKYKLEYVDVEVPKKTKTDEELLQYKQLKMMKEWEKATKKFKNVKWVKKGDPEAWNAKHLMG